MLLHREMYGTITTGVPLRDGCCENIAGPHGRVTEARTLLTA